MEHWYALYTKPHKEHHVSSFLESRGFETYLPAIQVRREGQKSTKTFFSCYLFVRLCLAEVLPNSHAERVRVLVKALGWMMPCKIGVTYLEKAG
jgi:hypothetical protein